MKAQLIENKPGDHLLEQVNVRYGSSDYLIDFFLHLYSNIINFTKNKMLFEYDKWYHVVKIYEQKRYYSKTTNIINLF